MASAAVYSGSKSENAIYVAFGVVIALGFVRWQMPTALVNPSDAAALVLLLGSIASSVVFYIKPERIAVLLLERHVFSSEGLLIAHFMLNHEICLETWNYALTRSWETPEERTRKSISRVVNSPDLANEIWGVKSAFLLFVSIPVVLYAGGFDASHAIFLGIVFFLWMFMVVLYDYADLPGRCTVIAQLRTLQDALYLAHVRDDNERPLGQRFRGQTGTASPFEKVVEHLDGLIVKRDWRGAAKVAEETRNDFDAGAQGIVNRLPGIFIQIWSEMNQAPDEVVRYERNCKLLALKQVLCYIARGGMPDVPSELGGLLENLCILDNSSLDTAESFFRCLGNLSITGLPLSVIDGYFHSLIGEHPVEEAVETILKLWQEHGHDFGSNLILAAKYVSEPFRKRILTEVAQKGRRFLQLIDRETAVSMVQFDDLLAQDNLAAVLLSKSPDVIDVASSVVDLDNPVLAVSFIKKISPNDPTMTDVVIGRLLREKKTEVCGLLRRLVKSSDSEARIAAIRGAVEIVRRTSLRHGRGRQYAKCSDLIIHCLSDPVVEIRKAAISGAYSTKLIEESRLLNLGVNETDPETKRMIEGFLDLEKDRQKSSRVLDSAASHVRQS